MKSIFIYSSLIVFLILFFVGGFVLSDKLKGRNVSDVGVPMYANSAQGLVLGYGAFLLAAALVTALYAYAYRDFSFAIIKTATGVTLFLSLLYWMVSRYL